MLLHEHTCNGKSEYLKIGKKCKECGLKMKDDAETIDVITDNKPMMFMLLVLFILFPASLYACAYFGGIQITVCVVFASAFWFIVVWKSFISVERESIIAFNEYADENKIEGNCYGVSEE